MKNVLLPILSVYHVIFLSILTKCDSKKVLSCYVMSWSVYRDGDGKFDMNNIEPYLCTHIIYGYRSLNSTTWQIESSDTWADNDIGNIKKLINLKEENPDLKILSSIGGWSQGSEMFSIMAAEKKHRRAFIDSVLQHLHHYKMDGLDIDWQYPTRRGGKPKDKENFVLLLKELRDEFDKSDYLLTVRLMGTRYSAQGYDLPRISEAVDFINLKSYSYHGIWESKTGVYSPLVSNDDDNLKFSVEFFLEEGVAKEKLLLGLTTEGNAFKLDNRVTDGEYMNQPAKEGFSGPWLNENGVIGFNEMCWELTQSNQWTELWDDKSQTPYAIKENLMTTYDNSRSFQEKMKLVDKKNLAGASIYSLDSDDFNGLCYDSKFILTYAARSSLNRLLNLQTTIINQQYP